MRAGILMAGLGSMLAAAAAPAAAQDFRWQGSLAAGKTLEVRGINGPIRAVESGSGAAEVTATKSAREGNPDLVDIRVEEGAEGVVICAVYLDREDDRGAGRCDEGRSGRGRGSRSSHEHEVSVAFEVKVPAGVRFTGGTVNGDIRASGLSADTRVTTVNGDVEVETKGIARASTVNGSIRATLGRGDWKGDLDLTTVNGGITLTLPGNAAADLSATTLNGRIESDFAITTQGAIEPRRLRGRIGDGGRGLRLSTVNGPIRIRRQG